MFDQHHLPFDTDPHDVYQHAEGVDGPSITTNGNVHIATPGEHHRGGSPIVLHRDPTMFAHALTQTALSAPLFDTYTDGEVCDYGLGLIVDPMAADVLEYIRRHTSDDTRKENSLQFLGLRHDDAEYIDGWSVHPGMIFRTGDYQMISNGMETRAVSMPMAKEDPEQYLRDLANSEPLKNATLIRKDEILEAGWSEAGSLHPNAREDFRTDVEEDGEAAVFKYNGSLTRSVTAFTKKQTTLA